MTGRVFGASLKPTWDENKINEFLHKTKGDITVFIINHDKDIDENGELLEPHTHIYLEYTNPRKITTVANLLEVEPNFVEVIRNKKGYLRYLTHIDEKNKHIYDADEVYTNSTQAYELTVRGNAMSDKEIAEYIVSGRGMELIGVVPVGKLRTIQGFIHFDQSNAMVQELKRTNEKLESVLEIVESVKTITTAFISGVGHSAEELTSGMKAIAMQLNRSNNILENRRRK